MGVQVAQHIGAGAHGLGLQGLQRPVPAHLIADDPVHIVLQPHHIDHGEIAAGAPVVLEAPPVVIAGEPGPGLLSVLLSGLDGQLAALAHVVLEQNPVGPCLHHAHTVGAGAHHIQGVRNVLIRGLGFLLGGIGPGAYLIRPVDPGHEAVVKQGGQRLGLLPVQVLLHQHVVAAHRDVAGQILPIGVLAQSGGVAVGQVGGLEDRHLGGAGVGAGQLHEVQVLVVITEAIALAAAVLVLQMGGLQLPQGVVVIGGGQTHPDGDLLSPVGGGRRNQGEGQAQRQGGGRDFCERFEHNQAPFPVDFNGSFS